MGYKIYHSNSLSSFVDKHSSVFHSQDLFGEKVVTVVQNSNIASWLKLELTKKDGISMDLEVEYPENAVKQLVLGFNAGRELFNLEGNSKSLLFMDSLKIVVFKTLETLLVDNREFPNLFNYVQNSSQRLFQVSDSIAGLFYHYGMNCPQMVSAWDNNQLYSNENGEYLRQEDQKWQMSLWNKLFNQDTPYLHISNVLNTILQSGESYNSEISPYGKCRVILFGSSFLGESAIKFFNYISKDIDVHHFILTPSKIYAVDEDTKPYSLLNRFSGLINGFTAISREPSFVKERLSFFKEDVSSSLLNKIQEGIRDNLFVEERRDDPFEFPLDNSLKICKVTGGWREIEVLKDKILTLLDNDSSLKLTDIGVVAPEISEYSSYIEGIFPQLKITEDGTSIFGKSHLPYNIMGLKGGEDSPYIRGILTLLELPGSDFNRKEIFSLISNPCFMEKFGLTNSSRDLFLESIENLNIKWGLDGEHKKALGYPLEEFNTWEAGFRRFLIGMALNREDHKLIPYNITDTSTTEELGELVHIVRSLYCDLFSISSLKLYMDEWVLLIETIMETYLKPVKNDLFDERERLSVKHQYRNILNLLDDLKNLDNFENREIPFAVFKSLLKEFIIKSGNNRGRYLTQGITFSSLKPLRAVPFKHIFVLGLNEDVFPGKERIPSYDLRGIYDQKIDLSKRQNDKFAFLELLLSASNSLTLFYSGKNLITGEELQPSVVISELLEAIDCNFNNRENQKGYLIEEHPLHNFDSKYFSPSSNLNSYNKGAYESAKAYLANKKESININLENDRAQPIELEITVRDLIQFIKNPVKTFFNKSLGIYLEESESLEEDIYENMELDFITKWKLANFVLEQGLIDDAPLESFTPKFFEIAKTEGVFKNSLLTTNVTEDVTNLIEGVDYFLDEHQLKGTSYQHVTRELGGDFKPLELNVDGIDIKITGELDNLWVDNKSNSFVAGVNLGSGKEIKVRSKIEPYVDSLIMFNHPEMREDNLKLYSIGKEEIPPVEFCKTPEVEGQLKTLISLYIKNSLNPIPLFPDIMGGGDEKEVSMAWEKSLETTMFHSYIGTCPYVKMVYGASTPEFNIDDIKDLDTAVYSSLKVNKEKK